MKHVTMGTAGHVDHGKTELVKRLTGVDTDRLPEEKERGLTIDLGFAPLKLPGGRTISIIDVPGHERFVKTMVAGVTGIDFVLLVVAADEGIMPQTREHLDILTLLGVARGVVALTKVDLVDSEWLQLVREDVARELALSSLAHARIIPVSAIDGTGIPELVAELEELAARAAQEKASELMRLPVDRVFTLSGKGLIVTGTLIGGQVAPDMSVEVLPGGGPARVRSVQVHGKAVQMAEAGQRCALNLVGIGRDDVNRGDVIARPETVPVTRLLDVRLNVAKGVRQIAHGERLRFLAGSGEVMARVRVIGGRRISGGQSAYSQLRLEDPVAVIPGDRYIVRSFSPVRTVGGGRILAVNPPPRKPSDEDALARMKIEDLGTLAERILLRIREGVPPRQADQAPPLTLNEISRLAFVEGEQLETAIADLVRSEALQVLPGGKYLPTQAYQKLRDSICTLLSGFRKEYPLRIGTEREEVRSTLVPDWDKSDFTALLELMQKDDLLVVRGSQVLLPDWEEQVAKIEARPEVQLVEEMYRRGGLVSPQAREVAEKLPSGSEDVAEAIGFLRDQGRLQLLGGGILLHTEVIEQSRQSLQDLFAREEWVTASQARQHLGCNRKAVIALLEYFDQKGWTQRQGNVRRWVGKET